LEENVGACIKRLPMLFALLAALCGAPAAFATTLTVGVYTNAPRVFVSQDGRATGITIDILREIAKAEHWTLRFVPCEWAECMAMLGDGRIDLLPDVVWSQARAATLEFHRTPVMHSWYQIYSRPGVTINSILDLKDKRVAVLRGSLQESFLAALLENFGLNTALVPVRSQEEALRMVDQRRVDAVATNHDFGDLQAASNNLVSTPVMFLPSRLYYAAAKGRQREVLAAIDRHLALWQRDRGSVYYDVLQRWQRPVSPGPIPPALWWTLAAVIGLLLSSLLVANWLRRQVARRTRDLRDSEHKLSTILDSVESLIYIKDSDYRYQYVNGAMCRLLGKPAAEIVGKDDYELFDKPAAQAVHETDRRVIEHGERLVAEEHKPRLSADAVFLSTKIPLSRSDGNIYALCGISIDITERKRVEDSLRLAATVFQSQEGMFVLGPGREILDINSAYAAMTGYTVAELAGGPIPPLSLGPDGPDFRATLWEIVERSGKWQGEAWTRRKGGEQYPAWMTLTAVHDPQGAISNHVGTQVDITERKEAEEKIIQLAYFDPLTGLPNRRLLLERVEHCIASSKDGGKLSALLFLDLDNFKDLNDTRGHVVGDQLLLQVAARLLGAARPQDTVARLGDDEFVIVLDGVGAARDEAMARAGAIAWNILGIVRKPYLIDELVHHATCSIGVVLYGDEAVDIEDLMRRGDLAMYEAKKAGRNTVRLFQPEMVSRVTYRTELETELRDALRHSEFVLYYQGQVNNGGHITGAEALLRWRHPQRGLMTPGNFIPVAETSGLILPLGRWVLREACSQLARWAGSPQTAQLKLAVNVSVRQFLQPDFVAETLATIADTGANPERLKLELTESLLIESVEETIGKMCQLKAHGVGFSLDDFGTGYSSLAYLKRLPLDQLKIDRSFVHDVLINPNDASIARSVVALAQALGLGTIAEGVETEAQRAFLAEIGCDTYQGFLFSHPVDADELEGLMAV
jgi:diguanylate cyclase (GGDEF)-like protein/PAS domain S-box-containing protein